MFRQSEPPAGMGPSAIVLGSFDGVHLGHQALLARARALADQEGLAAVAVTFRQHPLSVLCPERAPALLSTADERAQLMEALGMDGVIELEFTAALAGTRPEAFMRRCQCAAWSSGIIIPLGSGGRGTRPCWSAWPESSALPATSYRRLRWRGAR